jgi:hypothetical protein
MPVPVAVGSIAIRAQPIQADRDDGSPGHPAGSDSSILPLGPDRFPGWTAAARKPLAWLLYQAVT